MRKHFEMCVFLLDCGAKVDAINKFGESALHKACTAGSLELLELFVKMKADPTIQSAHGLPRDLLVNFQGGAPESTIAEMKSLLGQYENTFEKKAIDLGGLDGSGFSLMEDAMQRTKAITGVSFRTTGSEGAINVPKISVR
jgi:ankyrin repeat protein